MAPCGIPNTEINTVLKITYTAIETPSKKQDLMLKLNQQKKI